MNQLRKSIVWTNCMSELYEQVVWASCMNKLYEQTVWVNYMMNCVNEIKILKLNFIYHDQSFMKTWNNATLIDECNNVDKNANIAIILQLINGEWVINVVMSINVVNTLRHGMVPYQWFRDSFGMILELFDSSNVKKSNQITWFDLIRNIEISIAK